MKEINLKQILMSAGWKEPLTEFELKVAFRTGIYDIEHVLEAMQIACLQTVDLCADSADIDYNAEDGCNNNVIFVDKESILEVKNLII